MVAELPVPWDQAFPLWEPRRALAAGQAHTQDVLPGGCGSLEAAGGWGPGQPAGDPPLACFQGLAHSGPRVPRGSKCPPETHEPSPSTADDTGRVRLSEWESEAHIPDPSA